MTQAMRVPFAYLDEQFRDAGPIFAALRELVRSGDFTLGAAVADFEAAFAKRAGAAHAIGVNSGTDALKLSLRALGVGPGDEVVTAANTFIATVGAIVDVGARPVFVDVNDRLCLDPNLLNAAITKKTRAIIPVHLTGDIADMDAIMEIADRHALPVVEDACQAICSTRNGRAAGTWGRTGAYSLHPLKFLNIWGDGGVITTDDDEMAEHLRLLRNHGLADRDTVVMMGINSRLDTLQAIVASHVLAGADEIIRRRQANAARYDAAFTNLPGLMVPPREAGLSHTFVTYQIFADKRDQLLAHCAAMGIDAKVHYPVPVYRQTGLKSFGYRTGDFPVTDRQAATTLSLPVHQYLDADQVQYVCDTVSAFCRAGA